MSQKGVKTVQEVAARLFNLCEQKNYITGFSGFAKKKIRPVHHWFYYPPIRPYDRTGMFFTEEETIRGEMLHRLRMTNRAPAKKGQGKKAQLAAKAAAAAEKKSQKKK